MGSFNVAASMSNLTIGYNDKVVLIPLISKNFHNTKNGNITIKPTTVIVSNDMSNAFYNVRFLPIVGYYDDYGRIENIEKNENTNYIEEYFNLTIEKFVDIITTHYKTENDIQELDLSENKKIELLSLAGMFEHYSIYKDMVEEGKIQTIAYNEMSLSIDCLEVMGFVYDKNIETGDSRYSKAYIHPNFDKYIIHTDGAFSNLVNVKTNKKENGMYYPKDIISFLNKKSCKVNNIEELKSKSYYELALNQYVQYKKSLPSNNNSKIEELTKKLENERNKDDLMKLLLEMKEELASLSEFSENGYVARYYVNGNWQYLDYCLNSESLTKDFSELLTFNVMLMGTNNLYMPAMSGYQEGDDKASKKLLESTMRVLKSKK